MAVRIGLSVNLNGCAHCEAEFTSFYDAADMVASLGELKKALAKANISVTEAGFDRVIVRLNCGGRAVLLWRADDAIIESWRCI